MTLVLIETIRANKVPNYQMSLALGNLLTVIEKYLKMTYHLSKVAVGKIEV